MYISIYVHTYICVYINNKRINTQGSNKRFKQNLRHLSYRFCFINCKSFRKRFKRSRQYFHKSDIKRYLPQVANYIDKNKFKYFSFNQNLDLEQMNHMRGQVKDKFVYSAQLQRFYRYIHLYFVQMYATPKRISIRFTFFYTD